MKSELDELKGEAIDCIKKAMKMEGENKWSVLINNINL